MEFKRQPSHCLNSIYTSNKYYNNNQYNYLIPIAVRYSEILNTNMYLCYLFKRIEDAMSRKNAYHNGNWYAHKTLVPMTSKVIVKHERRKL